jgi:hypothetical protein
LHWYAAKGAKYGKASGEFSHASWERCGYSASRLERFLPSTYCLRHSRNGASRILRSVEVVPSSAGLIATKCENCHTGMRAVAARHLGKDAGGAVGWLDTDLEAARMSIMVLSNSMCLVMGIAMGVWYARRTVHPYCKPRSESARPKEFHVSSARVSDVS